MMAEAAIQTIPIPLPAELRRLPAWVKSTDVGLKFERKPTMSDWLAVIDELKKEKRSNPWRIGDGLNCGEDWFGEDYSQAIGAEEEQELEEITGETFRQYMQVARRVEFGRRLPNLSWSHHQVVAYLDRDEADAWLLYCAREKANGHPVSVHKLRKMVKESAEEQPQVQRIPDLKLLQDPEIIAWLEKDIEEQREKDASVPTQAGYLHSLIGSRIGQAQWQLDRTLQRDLLAVRAAVKATLGSDTQIYKWLYTRSFFMSDGDFEDYLDLLVADMRVKRKPAEGRKEGQKGGMILEHHPVRNPMDSDNEDDEDYY